MRNLLIVLFILTTILTSLMNNSMANTATLEDTNKVEVINTITSSEENDLRIYPRFENKKLKKPVVLERNNPNILGLVNISRGGVAIKHNNTLQPDDIISLNLVYEDISVKTNARVVFTREGIAGAEFINEDNDTFNKLLYLSVRLEAANGMLVTKLSEG